MASAITDLIDRVSDSTTGRPVISALASPGKAIGAVSLSLTDATNWTTSSAIHFSIYQVTAQGYKDPTTQTDWKGTLSGTTVTNLTLTGGTDRAYNTGDKVELTPTSRYAKDLYDWGITHANTDGTLKTSAVQQALNIATTSTDWTPLANTPTLVSSNGQREHVIRYSGVDYTDRLQAGTKLRIPRTSTAPTQSAQFVAASSQYAIKTTPANMTQTDDITAEAWVYLDSYTDGTIEAKIDSGSANGWRFSVNGSGQVAVVGLNGVANYRQVLSYQSVPLNKWTHLAATLDMSGWTAATNKIFIDGVDVPAVLNSAGTNPTSFVSAGDFAIGRTGAAATNYFNGKIANARVWSTIRTPAQIRDNMNKELVGNETGLAAYYKLNGNFNDSTANANNLTATGGAIATYADNPFKAVEYAVATNVVFTGGNTDVTIFSGSNAIPNETLGATSFSSARAPYGFPAATSSWSVIHINRNGTVSTGTGWFYTDGKSLTVPTGRWRLSYTGNLDRNNTAASIGFCTLSTSNSAESEPLFTAGNFFGGSGQIIMTVYKELPVSLAATTPYYIVNNPNGIGAGGVGLRGDSGTGGPIVIKAECAYL